MKNLFILLVSIFSVLGLAGCQNDSARNSGVKVIVDGDGRFPESLVGTWKSDNGLWEFVFEKDGSISSALISISRARIKPGKTTTVPMILGGKGIFEPGLWTVQYLQEQQQLTIEIKIEHFYVELGDDIVKGKRHDFFIGSVSGNGQLWSAKRFSFPENITHTNQHKNYMLVEDPNDNPKETLIFQKVVD